MVNTSWQTAHESGNVTNATTTGNVTESHPDKMIPGIELFGISVGMIRSDNGRKCAMAYQIVDKLRT